MKLLVWTALASLGCVVFCTDPALRAQDPEPTQPVVRDAAAILSAPPPEVVNRDLAPLSSKLPNSAPGTGILPPDASADLFDQRATPAPRFRGDSWKKQVRCWAASELRYRPVYFEDTALERYGQTRRPLVQTVVSGARFFSTFPALPYAVTVNSPRPTTKALGYFRPGNHTPWLLQRPPLELNAGIVQAGTAVGLIFLIP